MSLKHKDRLLSDIAEHLPRFEKVAVVNLRVRFFDAEGRMVKEFLGLYGALDAIANDLFWDEESDWREACSASVDTY